MLKSKEYEYKNRKCVYGVKKINNKKYFYKQTLNFNNELLGFNEINTIYTIPKLICCENNEIFFEYKKEFESQTIHDYLYNNHRLHIRYKKIFKQYRNSIEKIVIKNENEYRNYDFFQKRINYLDNYINNKLIKDKIYLLNGKEYKICEILKEIKDVISTPKHLKGILTIGDPTDTNISVKGIFSDLECAGYNSIVGEIAILFASFSTHGSYFYPKYNSLAYMNRTDLLFNYNKYKQNVVCFETSEDSFILVPKLFILKRNRKVLLKFLNFFYKYFKDDIEVNKYLKYYVCMRILTPVDVTIMDDDDRNIIFSLLINIYENCTSLKSLIKIVKKMEVRSN